MIFYKKYVTVLFKRYKGVVHYWLTFNEINCTLVLPYLSAGVIIDQNESREQQLYNATHHLLVASAWAVKIGHEIDPTIKLEICLREAHGIHILVIHKIYLQQLQKIGMHSFL